MPKHRERINNLSGGLPSISSSWETFSFHTFCQDSCEKKNGCTAVNWKHEGYHACILRACSLPVVAPKKSIHMWKAFYLRTQTTTTTTTPFTTTTTTTASSIQGSYHNFLHMCFSLRSTPSSKDERCSCSSDVPFLSRLHH